MSNNWDVRVLYELNSLIPSGPLAARLFASFANNALLRGLPIFFPLVALWFSQDSRKRQSRMMVGLFATCIATVCSLRLQSLLLLHTRPFLDPALHLQGLNLTEFGGWDHSASFPSDTATLFFSLATVIFLENRIAGGIAFFWSLLTVGLVRAALGWHYPSYVAGSFVLGPTVVYLITRIRFLVTASERLVEWFEPRIYILNALLFVFLADAYSLFQGAHFIIYGFAAVLGHLIRP